MKLSGIVHNQVVDEGFGRVHSFNYPVYNADPQPRILVLGNWKNQRTGNRLIGGINLNYLSGAEIEKLQKALPLILKPKDLKSRYWVGRNILPSIFKQYYRTYDRNYIQSIEPDIIKFGPDTDDTPVVNTPAKRSVKAPKRSTKPLKKLPKKERPQKVIKKKTTSPEDDISPEIGLPIDADLPKLNKQVGKKDTTQANKPTQQADKSVQQTSKPTQQIDKKQDQQKQDDITKQLDVDEKPIGPPPEIDLPDLNLPKKVSESRGSLWPSYDIYRRLHQPSIFLSTPALHDSNRAPLLAVVDASTGEVLIDRVEDHATIIDEAGWDYDHVIRLLPITDGIGGVRIAHLHDNLPTNVVNYRTAHIPRLVTESLIIDGRRWVNVSVGNCF